ncbi:MAG TPA: hypothetical protein VK608_04610 [Edaphobacter sp.]|nr:hypothetical protein [Edaphobacter sp.]
MQARLRKLKRLAALYGVVERMHSVELQRTAAAVREVEQAIAVQQTVVRSAGFDSRETLMTGDRMGWSLAKTQREIAEWKQERLKRIRLEREELSDVAREQYAASRVKSEQMKSVVDGVTVRAEVEEGRRMQAATDDRFLSRRLWVGARDEARKSSR